MTGMIGTAHAQASKPIVLGDANTKGTGLDSVTVGNGAQSTSKDNIAIGRDAQAGFVAPAGSALETDKPDTDLRAIAIGAGTKALEQDTIAIGFGALAEDKMTGAVALGAYAKAYLLGGVAIGFNSVTDTAAVSTANVTINGNQYNFAGNSAYSQISIGNAIQKRQLTNMAAGQINAVSTDGVNGSQLFATNSALGTLGSRVTVNETNISKNTGDINNITNGKAGLVQQAAGGENITVAKGLDGGAIDIAGTTAGKKGPRRLINLSAGVDDTDAVNVGQLKTVDGRVTANETRINYAEDNIVDLIQSVDHLDDDALQWDPAAGAFSAQHGTETTSKIANVKAGTDDTDAVNVGQLKGLADAEKKLGDVAVKYVWDDKNGNGELDAGEVVDYGKVKLAGAGANGTVMSNLGNGAVNATSMEAINGSQIFDIARSFGGGAGWNANGVFTGPSYRITVINQDGTLTSKDHDNVGDALGGLDNSVRIVNAKTDGITDKLNALGNDALIWDESKKAFTAGHTDIATRAVSGNNRITDLQAGTVSATSTDAVNGSQLNDTNNRVTDVENRVTGVENRVTTVEGDVNNIKTDITKIDTRVTNVEGDVKNIRTDITNITNVTDRAVTYDGKTGDPKTLIKLEGPTSSDGGLTGGTKITNLQQGAVNATSTDAVNGAQLNAANEKMKTLDDNTAKYKLNTVQEQTAKITNQYNEYLDQSKSYTDNVPVVQLRTRSTSPSNTRTKGLPNFPRILVRYAVKHGRRRRSGWLHPRFVTTTGQARSASQWAAVPGEGRALRHSVPGIPAKAARCGRTFPALRAAANSVSAQASASR
ncbi:autotransporter adhesin [Phyllobacterium trifolii]|uniref:Autotransporter adhesin n=1 Tax=Phyllobacterium trifolii TaxID=300193 RepID=A0A839U8J2_9HYPH|nr:hypothetical protein [Phyllobacterium trifolii]MBB3145041.1 autotransporter adhesin [Phyllobacterium trifolii]